MEMHVATRAWRYLDTKASELLDAVDEKDWYHAIATIDAMGAILIPPDHEDGIFLVLFEEQPDEEIQIRLYLTLGNLISRDRMVN